MLLRASRPLLPPASFGSVNVSFKARNAAEILSRGLLQTFGGIA
jgi:hypothetical protein